MFILIHSLHSSVVFYPVYPRKRVITESPRRIAGMTTHQGWLGLTFEFITTGMLLYREQSQESSKVELVRLEQLLIAQVLDTLK
jgi:hypothetical protein